MEITQQPQTNEVKKPDFLSRLSEQDRMNLERFNTIFLTVAKEMDITACLIIVGGAINKPLPRKDIDILAVLEGENLPKLGDFKDNYSFAVKDFELIETLLKKVSEKDNSFKIAEILAPTIDEEFQNPAILKHGGSIKLSVKEGTPLEIVREPGRGEKEVVKSITDRPFVIL